MLNKPKTITLTSSVGGETAEKTFRIGRYPATIAIEMTTRGAALLRDAIKGNPSNSEQYAKAFQKLGVDMCQYVEAQKPDGEFISIAGEKMLNAFIDDGDMFLQLMREVHDYNTDFFNTARLFRASNSLLEQAKGQITGIFRQWSDSSSPKSKPRSRS